MTFQMWSIDNPTYLKGVLPLFHGSAGLTNSILAKKTLTIGLNDRLSYIRHLTQTWYALGILDRINEEIPYKYKLSDFGNVVLNALQFNPFLAIDFLHWAWYSAWLRLPKLEQGWSWVYQETCNLMWENSPQKVAPKKLLADTLEKASLQFLNEIPTADIQSIRSVMTWLAALDPPFLIKKDETNVGSPWLSRKRESCSPELLFLAIQLQYQIKGLPFGTSLLIDAEIIETVSKACLLAPEQFWPMVELCGLTFASLTRKETVYGTSLTVTEPAPFTPPLPRSVKATQGEEAE